LEALLDQRHILPAYFLAAVYEALGDRDMAFEYLYQAFEKRWPFMVFLRSDLWFHSLHDDPRSQDLVKKMGFPDLPATEKR